MIEPLQLPIDGRTSDVQFRSQVDNFVAFQVTPHGPSPAPGIEIPPAFVWVIRACSAFNSSGVCLAVRMACPFFARAMGRSPQSGNKLPTLHADATKANKMAIAQFGLSSTSTCLAWWLDSVEIHGDGCWLTVDDSAGLRRGQSGSSRSLDAAQLHGDRRVVIVVCDWPGDLLDRLHAGRCRPFDG